MATQHKQAMGPCQCESCGCQEPAEVIESDSGAPMCAACADYATDDDGTVYCSRCPEYVDDGEWTGGSGMPHWVSHPRVRTKGGSNG